MSKTAIISNDLQINLEQQEAAYFSEYFRRIPQHTEKDLGLGRRKVGKALAFYVSKIDILAFNRVIGLGIENPADTKEVGKIISLYKNSGIKRFFIQVSPHARPESLPQTLTNRGFYHYNNWVKFYRKVRDFPHLKSNLTIEQIGRTKSKTFAEIIIKCFDWPEVLRPMISAPIGKPEWKHYLAYNDHIPIACAALYIRDRSATLAFAATLPEFQGRGAQSGLIARRFQDAAEAGCHWMFTETAEETPQRAVASYRNMKRHGFKIAYIRPNYLYEFK